MGHSGKKGKGATSAKSACSETDDSLSVSSGTRKKNKAEANTDDLADANSNAPVKQLAKQSNDDDDHPSTDPSGGDDETTQTHSGKKGKKIFDDDVKQLAAQSNDDETTQTHSGKKGKKIIEDNVKQLAAQSNDD